MALTYRLLTLRPKIKLCLELGSFKNTKHLCFIKKKISELCGQHNPSLGKEEENLQHVEFRNQC